MEKYIKKQIKDITSIPNAQFVEIYKDRYWAGDDEKNIYFYRKYNSPICNSNKNIIEKTVNRDSNPFTKTYFIKIVFIPINPTDWETV